MVGHQYPGQAIGSRFYQKFKETLKEELTIFVIEKDLPLLNSPDNDMLQITKKRSPGP